ncbi:hypothetical protein ACO0RG_001846 [Hanseniaspora osmophila]|uniref:Vacuolar basic amino acid transporter 1 n=1 Tax=Hanseniaspora osmophila TaxID=56408 RepID=A0A1E5RHT6_9ASCO|nr:Vacuolar basic amino acid transporter 1 [Hanseniaspora osmophila]
MRTDENTPLIVRPELSDITEEVEETANFEELENEYQAFNLNLPKAPILIALWLGSFLASLDNTVVANMMNVVSEEFHQSEQKQWIATSFLLTNTAFQPLYGKLSDLTGRKFALLCAHFFFGIGCFLTIFANSVEQFSIARAICGIGAGGLNAVSSIVVSDICTAKDRGFYQGYANLVFAGGQYLGAPLGGFLIDAFGWRFVFAVQIPMILICFVLTWTNVNIKLAHVPKKGRFSFENLSKIDLGGSLSLIVVIGGILILTSDTSIGISNSCVVLITLASCVVFLMNELYWCKERILPFQDLWGKFGVISLLTLTSSFVAFGEIFRKPVYLQLIQNFTNSDVGVYTIFTSFASPLASFVTGWILKKTSMNLEYCSYLLIASSFIFQVFGLGLESWFLYNLPPNVGNHATTATAVQFFLDNSKVYWKFILVFTTCLSYYGYCTLLVATLVSIVFSVEKSQQATFIGLFYLWRSIGNVLGASLTLTVFEKCLDVSLFKYFKNIDDLSVYKKLIHDSSLIRKILDGQMLIDVLHIYNNSIIVAYFPSIFVVAISIVIALVFIKVTQKQMADEDFKEVSA